MCTDISVVTCREKMLHLNFTDVHKDLQGDHNIVNSFDIQQTNHKKNIVILALSHRKRKKSILALHKSTQHASL